MTMTPLDATLPTLQSSHCSQTSHAVSAPIWNAAQSASFVEIPTWRARPSFSLQEDCDHRVSWCAACPKGHFCQKTSSILPNQFLSSILYSDQNWYILKGWCWNNLCWAGHTHRDMAKHHTDGELFVGALSAHRTSKRNCSILMLWGAFESGAVNRSAVWFDLLSFFPCSKGPDRWNELEYRHAVLSSTHPGPEMDWNARLCSD